MPEKEINIIGQKLMEKFIKDKPYSKALKRYIEELKKKNSIKRGK